MCTPTCTVLSRVRVHLCVSACELPAPMCVYLIHAALITSLCCNCMIHVHCAHLEYSTVIVLCARLALLVLLKNAFVAEMVH